MNKKGNKTLRDMTVCAIAVLALWIMAEVSINFGVVILIILSLHMVWPIRYNLLSIIKNSFVIKFYNIVIWFSSYVISMKLINYLTGIREEYLKFSPAILAIPISITLVFFIAFCFCLLSLLVAAFYTQLSPLLPTKLKVSIDNSRAIYIGERIPFLLILLLLPFFITTYATSFFVKLSILADASFVSDCGVKNSNIVYIRKNNKECYLIKLDSSAMRDKPIIIQKDKE